MTSRRDRDFPWPAVMPVDRERWMAELPLSAFVNAYYQYRDLQRFGDVRRLLMVGPGQGLATQVLRWKGYAVTTLDIDDTFQPDVTASVHDMSMFKSSEFDAVVASHVLEHLPESYLDSAMAEIARVGRYALIYLPVHGAHFQMRLRSNLRDSDLSLVVDVPRHLERPDGITPRYMGGQHYWEVGLKGFKKVDIVRRMSKFFDVIDCYRNRDWLPSQNFVLRARRFESS
jgi:hypothetical protein